MTDGIYINDGGNWRRPKSKKEIKSTPFGSIEVEGTSLHTPVSGNLGDREKFPVGSKITFVGPDPYSDRKFYGTLTVTADGVKVA